MRNYVWHCADNNRVSTTLPDLWPEDIGQTTLLAPLSILRDQAAKLGEKTGNIVRGAVDTSADRSRNFEHAFSVVAPTMGNFSCRIFRVKHAVNFYPLEVLTDIDGPNFRAGGQEEFLRALAEVFSSSPVKRMIHSLIAQSRVTAPAKR